MTIAGDPACALVVGYAQGTERPVVWDGEPCAELEVLLMSLRDLAELGHGAKLSRETRADVRRLPHGRVLYIEGAFTSAIYPLDRHGRPYTVSLAD